LVKETIRKYGEPDTKDEVDVDLGGEVDKIIYVWRNSDVEYKVDLIAWLAAVAGRLAVKYTPTAYITSIPIRDEILKKQRGDRQKAIKQKEEKEQERLKKLF